MQAATDISSSRRGWADGLVIVIFCGLLLAPTSDTLFHLDHSRQPGENRLPAPVPRLGQKNPAGLKTFLAASEAYFNDHFGFRKKLIRWYQNWKISLFRDRSVYNVITGRDGWLFTSDLQMVEHFLGMKKFTPAELKSWQRLLEKRRDWLAARGIKYLFVVPPDKQTVYPEYLPAWLIGAAPADRETKLDQFLRFMRENSTVEILDLRPALTAAKKDAFIYLQNDTHWNALGGFVSCQQLVSTLSNQFPDLPPPRLDDFQWTNAPTPGGDLARMIGNDAPDRNFFAFKPGPALPQLRFSAATNAVSFWDFHKPSRTVENPLPLRTTAVVFHDSFGNAWQQFLGYSLKKILFMPENREFNTNVILANKPDLVISEMLERYFNTQSPDELAAGQPLP
jgi:alginate O-acetyltransferase complex protein AlgJ